MRNALLLVTAMTLFTSPLAAQSLRECTTFEANARNIYGPYSETIREYANGAIRVIALDTAEPACCSFHVLVAHPAEDGPYPTCTLISHDSQTGFGALFMDRIEASYDPATGLTVTLPTGRWDEAAGIMHEETLAFTVNQAAGTVTLVPPRATPPEEGK